MATTQQVHNGMYLKHKEITNKTLLSWTFKTYNPDTKYVLSQKIPNILIIITPQRDVIMVATREMEEKKKFN